MVPEVVNIKIMIEKTTISKGKKLFGFTVVYDAITMKPKLLTSPMIIATTN